MLSSRDLWMVPGRWIMLLFAILIHTDKPVTNTVRVSMNEKPVMKNNPCSSSNTIYAVGMLGALLYFIQHAPSFWAGVLGVFKAILWPGVIVYKALEMLHL